MWNNNYQRSNNGYYARSYNSGNFRSGYRPQYNQQRPQKKRSGAKFGYAQGDSDRPYITGWNASRRNGLTSFIAGPNKKTKRVESKNGRKWENWTCKVTNGYTTKLVNCLFDVQNQKVIINDFGIVINPKAPNGGYCGRFTRRK